MKIDVVGEDRRGRAVLLAAVDAGEIDDQLARDYVGYLRESEVPARFVMVVDRKSIRLADSKADPRDKFVRRLDTAAILRVYDPELELKPKRTSGDYLAALVDTWLRDVAYHWRPGPTPGTEELAGTGLLEALEDGDTRREVIVETDSVS